MADDPSLLQRALSLYRLLSRGQATPVPPKGQDINLPKETPRASQTADDAELMRQLTELQERERYWNDKEAHLAVPAERWQDVQLPEVGRPSRLQPGPVIVNTDPTEAKAIDTFLRTFSQPDVLEATGRVTHGPTALALTAMQENAPTKVLGATYQLRNEAPGVKGEIWINPERRGKDLIETLAHEVAHRHGADEPEARHAGETTERRRFHALPEKNIFNRPVETPLYRKQSEMQRQTPDPTDRTELERELYYLDWLTRQRRRE